MCRNWLCLLSVTGLLAAASANAQDDGETLVREALCYACHQLNDASIGPPWRAIAARHGARRGVMTDVLASRIVLGGGGNWGLVPMVPNQRVTREQARIMAEWILSQ